MPTAEQASEVAWLEQAIADHEAALPEKVTKPLLADWAKTRLATLPEPARDGLLAHYTFEDKLADPRAITATRAPSKATTPFNAGRPGHAAAFNGEAQIDFTAIAAPRFAVAFWMRSGALRRNDGARRRTRLRHRRDDSHPQPDAKRGSPLYVDYQGRRWHSEQIVYGAQWHHIVVNFEGGKPKLLLDGKPVAMLDGGKAAPVAAGPLSTGNPHRDKPFKGDLGGLRIYDRALTADEAEAQSLHEPVRYILAQPEGKRSKDQNARLLDYFLTYDAPRGSAARLLRTRTGSRPARRSCARASSPSQVMAEMAQAARHVHPGARRLSQSRREGDARRARDAAALAQGRAARTAWGWPSGCSARSIR